MKKMSVWLALASLLATSTTRAFTLVEKFASDPSPAGWQIFGDTNLFSWNSTNLNLQVTWDSTQTNSYYYHPLGVTVTTNDGFCVVFDLQLKDATSFNSGFELAVGLLNFAEATNVNFSRANGTSPDVCEFDYFPQYTYAGTVYPSSIDATLIDTATNFYFAYDNQTFIQDVTYHVLLLHRAGTTTISGEVFTNGQLMSSLPNVGDYRPPSDNGAFNYDTLSISSYTDDGFGDSILAHGAVANLAFATPLPIGVLSSAAPGQVQFGSDTNWNYTLFQSADFQNWSAAAPTLPGNGANLVISATNPPVDKSFYQVRADLR